MKYSGSLRRFLAFTVDTLILIGVYLTLGLILSLNVLLGPIMALPMIGFWFYGGLFLTALLYYAAFESSHHKATIGKRLLGLKVVDLEGNSISFLRAACRYTIHAILRIGFILMFFTKKKQGLHDKLTKVVIVRGSNTKHEK